MSTTSTRKGAAATPPKRGPEHDLLDMFVGTWVGKGKLPDGTPVTVTEDAERLPGGFFLLQREEMRMGSGDPFRMTRIIGFDPDEAAYVVHHFDSFGFARRYRATVKSGTWTLIGDRERATFVVAADGKSFSACWEQRAGDGRSWQALCEFEALRR